MTWHSMVKLFDFYLTRGGRLPNTESPPTPASIQRIEQSLQLKLPPSLVRLAGESQAFSLWFASLGEDFDSPNHLLQINQLLHTPDQDADAGLPAWLVVINLGFDGDCDGLDTRFRDPETGEYPIQYWDYNEGLYFDPPPAKPFLAYLETQLKCWIEGLKGEELRHAQQILES